MGGAVFPWCSASEGCFVVEEFALECARVSLPLLVSTCIFCFDHESVCYVHILLVIMSLCDTCPV